MKKLGILGILSIVILLAGLLLPSLTWTGAANVQFRFHIIESRSARAVRDAKIRVVPHYGLSDTNSEAMFPAVITDAGGLARVSVLCGAGGSKGLFGRTGNFVISHELLVEANGYRPVSIGLANVVGGRRWRLSKRLFDVELALLQNP
jgi:hypothetical protein